MSLPFHSLSLKGLDLHLYFHTHNSFPSEVVLLHITRVRCVIRRRCADDGPLTSVKDPYYTLCMSMDYVRITVLHIDILELN